jgi:predicted nucleic acid-binding Zn ribbon protein
MKRPAPIGDLLTDAFSGAPIQKRLREAKIWQVWAETVGPQIASKAEPLAIRDGVLTIRVASSPWLQQLSFMKPDLMEHLNRAVGEPLVTDLFFKVGKPAQINKEPAPRETASRPLSPGEEQWLCQQTEGVNDPELRQAFRALLARHLADRPSER